VEVIGGKGGEELFKKKLEKKGGELGCCGCALRSPCFQKNKLKTKMSGRFSRKGKQCLGKTNWPAKRGRNPGFMGEEGKFTKKNIFEKIELLDQGKDGDQKKKTNQNIRHQVGLFS